MQQLKSNLTEEEMNIESNELACGNCWGHQQYEQGYRAKKFDYWKGRKDNFISRFVRRHLKS
ncbi:MAG: hypothetical protein ACI86M_000986 [Saprospiraceae bacterium]|jgi:hypothetical protein